MNNALISSILAAKRIGGREEFHRRLFDTLLASQRDHAVPAPAAADVPAVLAVLTRWIVEAPVADELGVLRLLAARGAMRVVVKAAGAGFGAFVGQALGVALPLDDPSRLPAWKQAKLAALADATLLTADAFDAWRTAHPQWAHLAAIVCLADTALDHEGARAIAAAGGWLAAQEPVAMPARFIEQLKMSSFSVSYLADGRRHEYKRAIVRQAARMLRDVPCTAMADPGTAAPGPVRLTIVGELLFPQHAMFRCYVDVLSDLKRDFHVTLLADEPTRCPEHGQFSHEQAYFPPHERDVSRLARMVEATRPHIVLYPSVGMTYWTFALSLLRLAPLQLMSVGHPAPSCSDAIDGTLVYRELAESPLPEYGTLLTYDRQPLPLPPPGGWHDDGAAADSGPVIAVNAAAMKLTPAFLDAVGKILAAAPGATTLQFFPNLNGAALSALRRDLNARFPQAVVHGATGYADYMRALAQSDLVLQSFPFGGTNTAMDALALGIPMLCLKGGDLAAAVDPVLLRHAGLETLCAATEDEYVARAVALLQRGPEWRRVREVSRNALRVLGERDAVGPRSMADAIGHAWQAVAAR